MYKQTSVSIFVFSTIWHYSYCFFPQIYDPEIHPMALSSVCIFRIACRRQTFIPGCQKPQRTEPEGNCINITWWYSLRDMEPATQTKHEKREPFTSQNTMEKETLAGHL